MVGWMGVFLLSHEAKSKINQGDCLWAQTLMVPLFITALLSHQLTRGCVSSSSFQSHLKSCHSQANQITAAKF